MYDFFVKLLNMSLAASIIILVIVVLRLLLKKAPRNIICFLWVLVALHNSFFRYEITNVRKETRIPLELETHPLAYLLMLCDELQCWDRVAYGQNSRNELHPMGCRFRFSADGLCAVYAFDSAFEAVKEQKRVHIES